jgi:hypothetical protein
VLQRIESACKPVVSMLQQGAASSSVRRPACTRIRTRICHLSRQRVRGDARLELSLPPYHRGSGKGRGAQAGHRGHESPATPKYLRAERSGRAWKVVVGLVFAPRSHVCAPLTSCRLELRSCRLRREVVTHRGGDRRPERDRDQGIGSDRRPHLPLASRAPLGRLIHEYKTAA